MDSLKRASRRRDPRQGESRQGAPRLRRLTSSELTPADVRSIRSILDTAFGDGEEAFAEEDWTHALGGLHFVLDVDDEIVTHASVVERTLRVGARTVRTGYVEAVVTTSARQRHGFGSIVMEAAGAHIRATFELGALGTGRPAFYERLGWVVWAGPAFVEMPEGPIRTPGDEGSILVLRTPTSPPFDGTEPITCLPRAGEPW